LYCFLLYNITLILIKQRKKERKLKSAKGNNKGGGRERETETLVHLLRRMTEEKQTRKLFRIDAD
jgi:hypothetical protein